ncbi:hypothetical protein D3C73_1100670 [compost metagenome]
MKDCGESLKLQVLPACFAGHRVHRDRLADFFKLAIDQTKHPFLDVVEAADVDHHRRMLRSGSSANPDCASQDKGPNRVYQRWRKGRRQVAAFVFEW